MCLMLCIFKWWNVTEWNVAKCNAMVGYSMCVFAYLFLQYVGSSLPSLCFKRLTPTLPPARQRCHTIPHHINFLDDCARESWRRHLCGCHAGGTGLRRRIHWEHVLGCLRWVEARFSACIWTRRLWNFWAYQGVSLIIHLTDFLEKVWMWMLVPILSVAYLPFCAFSL